MITPDNTGILTVNYNTPDLIMGLYASIRDRLGADYIFNVVDGSDKTGEEAAKLDDIINKDSNSKFHKLGYNIHHGPGLDYGIRLINKEYILVTDSDVILTSSKCLDAINRRLNTEDFYGIGNIEYVNYSGFNADENKPDAIKYLHPRFMLINKKQYLKFPPFIKHGAPCIKAMVKIKDKGLTHMLIESGDREVGWKHFGRSTLNRGGEHPPTFNTRSYRA